MGSQTVADDFPYINAVISMASPREIDLERRKKAESDLEVHIMFNMV